MLRVLASSGASSVKIAQRRQLPSAASLYVSNDGRGLHTLINAPAPAPAPPPPPRPTFGANHLPAPLYTQSFTFSTNSNGSTPKKKRGLLGKVRHMIRTIFGVNDDTPRGIQERKDMHWIVLAVAHRKLRMESQRKLIEKSDNDNIIDAVPSQMSWQEESKEQLMELMEEAVAHLDEQTDIGGMPLRKLRPEIQSFLEPQIIQLLNSAYDVEHEMYEEGEDYTFGEEEEEEYKEILLREHENVCQLLKDCDGAEDPDKVQKRTSDPVPFYEMKKGAIETLLTYFDWWPDDSSKPTTNPDEEEHVDEFGFSPSNSDSEIIPAMRYYHVRNLVRSSLVRRTIDDNTSSADDSDNPHLHGYHSLLPLKSTIPSAGRGVFVDGFAPAGTLLAFLPGKVWPKEHLQSASLQTQMQLAEDPRHQLSLRYDDILIDSRRSPYTVVKNLWALGHIFNHPSPPTLTRTQYATSESKKEGEQSDNDVKNHPLQGPNCITVPINFTDKMIEGEMEKLRDFIPNEYEHLPKEWAKSKSIYEKDEVIMHGMGLVALRDVKDEELFYDYRLSPEDDKEGSKYPSWYYVWDQEAINNRWDNDDS